MDVSNRDVVFIPKSAHGTNFATAAMAGFTSQDGIVYLEANENGTVNMDDFHEKISLWKKTLRCNDYKSKYLWFIRRILSRNL